MKNYFRLLLIFFVLFLPQESWAAALLNSAVQYVGSVEWAAVSAYPGATTLTAAGTLTTNTGNSPTLGNERVYVAITGGTTGGLQPTFNLTKGSTTTDGTVVWIECTGQPGVNGDTTNSPVWGASLTTTQGQIIYDSGTSSLQMVLVAGTTGGSSPAFSATAGTATVDNTTTWHSLGLASAFGAFAAPHKRVLNADAATWETVVPAKIYITSDHAESQGSALTLAGGQGVAATPNQYLSVVKTTVPPTGVTPGASIATTGTAGLTQQGFGYYNGITFTAGSGSSPATLSVGTSNGYSEQENCTYVNGTTAAGSSQISIGCQSGQICKFVAINPTFVFGSTSQGMLFNAGDIQLIGGTYAATGSAPSKLLGPNGTPILATIRDADLSNITGTLFSVGGNYGYVLVENSKLASGVAMTSGSFNSSANATFKLHNADSGSKNYRFYETNYLGTIQQETTTVDSTNPATDGTTPISWNIATSANTAFGQPYATDYLPVSIWENTTGSAISPQIQIAGANSLTNADIWPECEFFSTSGFPLGVAVSGRAAPLATPVAWTTSTDSWGGSPAHTQYMSVTSGTIQLAGTVKCRVYMAKPSTTEYITPSLTNLGITSGRQYLVPGEGYINEGPSGGGSGGTVGYAY